MEFKHSNCIVVFNKTKDSILFCKRNKNPYKGLYNFVGGKVEPGESSETAAYRELKEETKISDQNIAHIINIALMYPIPDRRLNMKLQDIKLHN